MNVLALYDIHGNVEALEAVLADAPSPDVILVGGRGGERRAGARDGGTQRRGARRCGADALKDVGAALVVAGHTHQADDRTVAGTRFINAGSVGMPYEGDGAARWLWVADGVPEFRTTSYDAAAAGARILESGWPDARSINASLIEPVPAIEITRFFEDHAGR